MPPRLHKILRLELPFADAMDIVLQAVQAIPANIEKVDDKKGSLTAKTHLSLKSHGENIRVQVEALDKGGCQVRIDSELMLILTESQLDWGVNTHNIEQFEKAMEQGMRKWQKVHKAKPARPTPAPQSAPAAGLVQMQCNACGAKLTSQPKAGHWVCAYCGQEYFEKA